ncbi:hypothetical protein BH23CHL1_BH23CHL1_03320 [soil metagenome]
MNNDDTDRNRRDQSHDGHSGPADGIHPAVEILSEYLGQAPELAQAERDAIDRHLIGCEQCQRVLNELQLMVRTLGTLPEMTAPRSFALRPEALEPATTPERTAPIVLQESAQWHERHAGKVRWATAVAAMLFVFVISADLVTNGLRGSDDMAMSSGGDQMEVMQATEATPAAAGAAAGIPTAEIAPGARTTGEEAPASDDEVPESDDSTAAQEESLDEPEVGTFMEPSEDVDSGDDAGGQETLTMQQEATSEEPNSEAQASADSSQMRWRIAEVSLALVLAILLAVMIGLPKQRGRRRR